MQLKQLVGLSPSLSSPPSSLVPPNIIRDTLLAPPCFSPGTIPVIADLQDTQPSQTMSTGKTFQLEILVCFAVWHPPLLLGQAPVAPMPEAAGGWALIRKRAERRSWRAGGKQGAAACCSLGSWQPRSVLLNTLSA